MASDDPIPSFLSLQPRKRRQARSPQPQLLFDLDPSPPTQPPPAKTLSSFREAREPAVALPTPKPPPREPILYTVRQLIAELRLHIESAYTGILNVEGEISNCRPAASGHLYFTLKDGDAQLPVVMFRRAAQLLGFKPKDGLAVEVRGRISVYETRGQLQLIAETLRPRGEGALQIAFDQLKRKLAAEGLFDSARKRPLPPFPQCIGIITSPNGAALRDIIHVIRRRHARLNLLIYPAIMQGAQCGPTVAAGVRWFNSHPDRVDLILIARGGGSLEDLAGFNDETLARVIAASQLPTVSAIGHEIDHTIADFVADLRAPTPSAAAELITGAQHRIEERIISLERRVYRASEYHLLRARQRLARLSASHVLARLRDSIGLRQQRVDDLRQSLGVAMARHLRNRAHRITQLETRLRRHDPSVRLAAAQRRFAAASGRLERISADLVTRRSARLERAHLRLEALSPLAVLNRGYAIIYAPDGSILRNASQARAGSLIRARLATGSLRATVLTNATDSPDFLEKQPK